MPCYYRFHVKRLDGEETAVCNTSANRNQLVSQMSTLNVPRNGKENDDVLFIEILTKQNLELLPNRSGIKRNCFVIQYCSWKIINFELGTAHTLRPEVFHFLTWLPLRETLVQPNLNLTYYSGKESKSMEQHCSFFTNTHHSLYNSD